ncbi:MAG: hypothetical protein U0Y68_06600 [Blastocatellia bacterium]
MKKLFCQAIFSAFFFALLSNHQPVLAQSTKPAPKAVSPKPKLTEVELVEARERLGQLGYWVDLEAKGLDASLHHALIAFQKSKAVNELARSPRRSCKPCAAPNDRSRAKRALPISKWI